MAQVSYLQFVGGGDSSSAHGLKPVRTASRVEPAHDDVRNKTPARVCVT